MSKIKPITEKNSLVTFLNHYRYVPLSRTRKPKFLTNIKITKKNQKKKVLLFPNNRKLSFDLLNVFYTITVCGNIKLASERLYISQPAINICINRLEKELGTLLFQQLNSKKIIKLTPSGLILFNYIQRLFQIIQETINFSNCHFLNLQSQKFHSQSLSKKNQFPSVFNSSLILNRHIVIINNKVFNYNKSCFYLKNFLTINYKQLKHFQTKSKFFLLNKKFKNLNSSFLLFRDDSNLTSFEISKLTSIKFIKINTLNSINNSNLVEVHTGNAFNTCIELKISNLICWGSEI